MKLTKSEDEVIVRSSQMFDRTSINQFSDFNESQHFSQATVVNLEKLNWSNIADNEGVSLDTTFLGS